MGQNAVVCVGLVGVWVSGDGLSGCDWVVGTGVWDLEGCVCVVVVGGVGAVVLGCVYRDRCLCLCVVGPSRVVRCLFVGGLLSGECLGRGREVGCLGHACGVSWPVVFVVFWFGVLFVLFVVACAV